MAETGAPHLNLFSQQNTMPILFTPQCNFVQFNICFYFYHLNRLHTHGGSNHKIADRYDYEPSFPLCEPTPAGEILFQQSLGNNLKLHPFT